MTHDSVPQNTDRDHAEPGEVPAGGGGADTGAAEAVGIDPDDRAEVQNVSSQNDIPGVGTRAPDADAADSTGDLEQAQRAADPAFVREDEHPGAATHNARVSERDSDDPVRARSDDAYQHLPRMAQNAVTPQEELDGIVAQTRYDLRLGIPSKRAPEILRQRLDDAGIAYDDALIDDLAERVTRPE